MRSMVNKTELSDTQTKIIDEAEKLFASRGYYGVSLRDISGNCGISLNLIRYHFGSKDDLFRFAIQRRTKTINRVLLSSLNKVLQHSSHPSIQDVVSAYVTAFDVMSSRKNKWRTYLKLLIHCDSLIDKPELIIGLREAYQSVYERYVAAFESCGLNNKNAIWAVYFMHTVVGQSAVEVYSISHLSNNVCDPNNDPSHTQRKIQFIANGLSTLVN
nr:TetR/AcrR family transcriptional regulator [Spongiibacter thalassae]